MTDIGELVVRIKADATQLQQELRNATTTTKDSAAQMSSAFDSAKGALATFGIALGAAQVIEFAKGALEGADNIYIMAQRIGFASSTLSALNIPLKQNGSSVDEFASSMKFMSRNIELASEGNKGLIQRFDSLGLSVTKLKSMTPEEQFFAIAKALGQVTDQGQLTADMMTILGRGAAGLIPIIKEAGGNLEDFINKTKGLTDEEAKKVHEYEDAWISFIEHLKIKIVEGVVALHDFAAAAKAASDADTAGLWGTPRSNSRVSTDRPKSVSEATFLNQGGDVADLFDSRIVTGNKSAKGNNNDVSGADSTAASNAKALKDYIQNLKDETAALSLGKEKLAEYKNEKAAAAAGGKEITDLTAEEKDAIDSATLSYEKQKDALMELQKEEQKHIQLVAHMESQISSSLADIAVNYKNLGTTISGVLTQIAKQLIEMQITTPLVEAIGGTKSSPGLFSSFGKMLGFADGGSPPVGVPSIVGEDGPELFIPNQSGTIVPNGGMGGTSISQTLVFNMQPGLAETVGAAIRQSAPQIAAMAHASIIQATQSGGPESRVFGRRS